MGWNGGNTRKGKLVRLRNQLEAEGNDLLRMMVRSLAPPPHDGQPRDRVPVGLAECSVGPATLRNRPDKAGSDQRAPILDPLPVSGAWGLCRAGRSSWQPVASSPSTSPWLFLTVHGPTVRWKCSGREAHGRWPVRRRPSQPRALCIRRWPRVRPHAPHDGRS